jgi:hypothetical protein
MNHLGRCKQACVGVFVLAAAMLLSRPALACHDSDGDGATVICFTAIHAGVATSVFAPADIYYAHERRWLSPRWAWPQLFLGGIVTMAGGAVGMGLAASEDEPAHLGQDIAAGVGVMFVGSFYAGVATWSLQRYRPPASDKSDEAVLADMPIITVNPTRGGATLTASASF